VTLKSWELEWTNEQITEFWDAYSIEPRFNARYFSRIVGHSVVNEFKRFVAPASTVLDFGAGKGYLTKNLLDHGFKTIAVDSSADSIRALQERFSRHPNLIRAEVFAEILPVDSRSLDAVLLIEVIEHLREEALSALLKEMSRALRPGGILFVTTPNNEDLDAAMNMCPHCGCIFHPIQHLRSFTRRSLSRELERNNLRVIRCKTTYFTHLRGAAVHIDRLRRLIGPSPWPNLYAVAQKP